MPGIFDLVRNGQSPQQLAQMFRGLGNSRWMQQPTYSLPTILPPPMPSPGAPPGGGVPPLPGPFTPPNQGNALPPSAGGAAGGGGAGGPTGGGAGTAGTGGTGPGGGPNPGGIGDPNSTMGQVTTGIGSLVGMINPLMGVPMMASNLVSMMDDNPNTNQIGLQAAISNALFGGPTGDASMGMVGNSQQVAPPGFSGTIGQPTVSDGAQVGPPGFSGTIGQPAPNVMSALAQTPVMSMGPQGNRGSPVSAIGPRPSSAMAAQNRSSASGVGPEGAVGVNGGPGGAAPGTAICTELHRQGLLDSKTFAADAAWGDKVPAFIRSGYHLWALPLVARMRRDPVFAKRVAFYSWPVTKTLAAFMGHGRPSILGLVMLAIGLPVCALLGLLTPCISPSSRPI